jgi:hypothetical protein
VDYNPAKKAKLQWMKIQPKKSRVNPADENPAEKHWILPNRLVVFCVRGKYSQPSQQC